MPFDFEYLDTVAQEAMTVITELVKELEKGKI
jgi:hypothetical protein